MERNQVVELRENVTGCMAEYESLLNEAGMCVEAQQINQKIDEFCQGLFQVLFTGVFSAGKSTTLNALMHQKLLYVSINPATPVITRIINGDDSNIAVVTFRDSSRPDKTMTIEEFAAEYRLTESDPGKFREIKYVTIQRHLPTETVIFADSPGLQNNDIDSAIANEFATKADAIVFLMNATKAMDMSERDYIRKNFEKRGLDNVFFVVNWYNLVSPVEDAEFKQKLLFDLKDVFTDKDGVFNEELYNSRVFFVDSFTSECARTGSPKVYRKGTKLIEEIVPMEEDEYTGIPEFETSLYKFLQSSDKDKAGYRGYLPKMAAMYKATSQTVEQFKEDSGKNLEELRGSRDAQKKAIDEISKVLDALQHSYDNTITQIMVCAQDAYNSFVTSTMNNWQPYFQNCEISFGMKEIGKITALKTRYKISDILSKNKVAEDEREQIKIQRDKEFQEIMKPISDAIEQYIQSESGKMTDMIMVDSNVAIKRLEEDIERYCDQIEQIDTSGIDLQKIIENIKGGKVDQTAVTGDFNLAQVLIAALMFTNLDEAVDGIVGGKESWGEYLKKVLGKEIKELVLAFVINLFTGVGWVYYVFRAVWGVITLNTRSSEYGQKMVMASKEATVQGLMDQKDEFAVKMRAAFSKVLNGDFAKFTKEIKDQMAQKNEQLQELIENLEKEGFDVENELSRLESVKEKMVKVFNTYAEYVGVTKRTEEQILDYAVELNSGLK